MAVESVYDFELQQPPEFDYDCPHKNGVVEWKFKIARVVGSQSAVDSSGLLTNPSTAIANGIVSAKANLVFDVTDRHYGSTLWTWRPIQDKIMVNGHTIAGTTTSSAGPGTTFASIQNRFEVPIEYLKFARRVPGEALSEDRYGENTVTLVPNQNVFDETDGQILCGGEVRELQVWPMRLEFDAMAPVILIHGNNSTSAFFDAFGFYSTLANRGMPVDKSVQFIPSSGLIEENSGQLLERVPAIAREFGAQWVHLVTHSKGGLDARRFLVRLAALAEPEVGVLSLTTLATPHMGSVGADYSVAVSGNKWTFPVWLTPTLHPDAFTLRLFAGLFAYSEGADNLRVSYVRDEFNPNNLRDLPLDTSVSYMFRDTRYRALGADANVDNSTDSSGVPTIPALETVGAEIGVAASPDAKARILQFAYTTLGWVRELKLNFPLRQVEVYYPVGYFAENDFLVTKDSATLANSSTLHPFQSPAFAKKNHGNVADGNLTGDVIPFVLDSIRQAGAVDNFH